MKTNSIARQEESHRPLFTSSPPGRPPTSVAEAFQDVRRYRPNSSRSIADRAPAVKSSRNRTLCSDKSIKPEQLLLGYQVTKIRT